MCRSGCRSAPKSGGRPTSPISPCWRHCRETSPLRSWRNPPPETPMRTHHPARRTRCIFRAAAALILAHQVAGKAARDGLFLTQFSAADLPKAVIAAALVSVLLGLAFTRSLPRYGPMRLVPSAFAAGGLLHLAEYALLHFCGAAARGAAVVFVYLHLAGFGAILLSGFWSMASEAFDPREAKREFGRIAGSGTAGGVLGGILAERIAAWCGGDALAGLLAVLHLGAWLVLRNAGAANESATEASDPVSAWQSARDAFRRAPFLINLSLLVLISTVSATLLDFVFKSSAAASFGKGPQLTRYFAVFYTGAQIVTFLAQTFAAPPALRRLGLGRTMQFHSAGIALSAGASLFLPGALMAPLARALELALRGSCYRSSYELFFTPVPPREKRATKMFIDVSCDRMGDAAGAILLSILLAIGPRQATMPILLLAASLGALGFWITRRMDAAYSGVLERGLVNRAIAVGEGEVRDSTTLAVLLHSTAAIPRTPTPVTPPTAPPRRVADRLLFRLGELRSGVPARVREALAPEQTYDPILAPAAIRLLAWDQTMEWARAFLLRHAHRMIGQLVDVLLDGGQDAAIRRRIPHILAYTTSQRAVDGL